MLAACLSFSPCHEHCARSCRPPFMSAMRGCFLLMMGLKFLVTPPRGWHGNDLSGMDLPGSPIDAAP